MILIVLSLTVIFSGCSTKKDNNKKVESNVAATTISNQENEVKSESKEIKPENVEEKKPEETKENNEKKEVTAENKPTASNTAAPNSSNSSAKTSSNNSVTATPKPSTNNQAATTNSNTAAAAPAPTPKPQPTPAPAPKPTRASGIDWGLTNQINDSQPYVSMQRGYPNGKTDELIQASVSVAFTGVVPENIKQEWLPAPVNEHLKFKYMSHTVNIVSGTTEYSYLGFKNPPDGFNDGFLYVIAYWDSSINNYKLYYVKIRLA
ncbi:MAG: hypothetical protein J0I68_00230 [Achromobacter sp.]|uniref:hypothetical protein n=1 Tax=Achromobacter sp. TaxID=134375 RepID=UPI001AC50F8B|nr:hypothetical protein [Achromobacter sp.]MBN9636930.1 hypothetical protein [Achromobacter sp.]